MNRELAPVFLTRQTHLELEEPTIEPPPRTNANAGDPQPRTTPAAAAAKNFMVERERGECREKLEGNVNSGGSGRERKFGLPPPSSADRGRNSHKISAYLFAVRSHIAKRGQTGSRAITLLDSRTGASGLMLTKVRVASGHTVCSLETRANTRFFFTKSRHREREG